MISIIVPVYNVAEYLSRCVASVLKQSYKDWELILVNDGSTDQSGALCQQYAQSDVRIRTLHQKNQGQAAARNAGLEAAQGEYLAFCDADDWLTPDFLTQGLATLLESQADLVTANYYHYHHNGQIKPVFNMNGPEGVFDNRQAMKFLLANEGTSSSVGARIYRRELFEGLRFIPGRLFEDAAISHQLFQRAKRVAFLRQPMMYYLKREGSTMSRRDQQIRLDELQAASERYWAIRQAYDDELATLAFASYLYDLIHVKECFLLEGYPLTKLAPYETALRTELAKYHYRFWQYLPGRKKIEAGFLLYGNIGLVFGVKLMRRWRKK
ncbi:glycosyltransferase [Ligilactobacillus equi]|uniref:glycosyltransferase family 2 protein n=1 Tax=Ligilactobacillus equi TaxID=137357 RepID=UPI002ED26E4D